MASDSDDDWNLARLRVFATVVSEGSLTRAGSVLGLPQPAVSRQISKLESQCGGRLFNRTGRGVTLSDLGERVKPRIFALLEDAQTLAAEVNESADTVRGDVRLGTLPSLHLTLVIPLFFHLREHKPGIRLQVFEGSAGQIDQWLASGYVDIGLPYRYGKTITDAEPLADVTSYLLGPPGNALVSNRTVAFRALDGVPLVLPGAPSSVRLLLDRLARKHGIRLNVAMEADSTQIQKAIARLGGAFAVVPAHAASEEIANGTLAAARIVRPEIGRTIALAMTAARPASRATLYTGACHPPARRERRCVVAHWPRHTRTIGQADMTMRL